MKILRWLVLVFLGLCFIFWHQSNHADRLMVQDAYEKVVYTVKQVVQKSVFTIRQYIHSIWPYSESDEVVIQKIAQSMSVKSEYNESPCAGSDEKDCTFNNDFFNDTYFEGMLDMDRKKANVDLQGLADSENY